MMAAATRLGRYDLIRPIATGGMAEIYLAAARGKEGCEKLVVIKRMLPRLAAQAEHVAMFLDEARIIAQLSHSNIVQFYDLEEHHGEYFIIMELLRGGDVLQLLRAAKSSARPFGLDAALAIALGASAALHYAHEKTGADGQPLHIVHRDVSPENVFVTFTGGVKLLDFGVARADGRDNKTRFGVFKGKLSYVSPEQARGQAVDRRSDVFSLCILLWELTTGERLFPASDDYTVLKSIVERDPTLPSDVLADYPPELERIVMKGLRRDPNQRYQTAQELQIDLEEFALDHKISTSPRSVAELARQVLSLDGTNGQGPPSDQEERVALASLTGGDAAARRHAVEYFVETRSPAGAQRIRETVENELDRFDTADQRRLCLALAVLLGQEAVDVLLRILEQTGRGISSTESARIAAAAALGETGNPRALVALSRVAGATVTHTSLRKVCQASLHARILTPDPQTEIARMWPREVSPPPPDHGLGDGIDHGLDDLLTDYLTQS